MKQSSRSFAPLLLIAGLITLAPVISTVPGIPTFMAVLVLLVTTATFEAMLMYFL